MINRNSLRSLTGPAIGVMLILGVVIGWLKLRPETGHPARYDVTSRLPEWSPPEDDLSSLPIRSGSSQIERQGNRASATSASVARASSPYDTDPSHAEQFAALETVADARTTPVEVSIPRGRLIDVVPVQFDTAVAAEGSADAAHRRVIAAHFTTLDGARNQIVPVAQERMSQLAQLHRSAAPVWLIGTIEPLHTDR